MGGRRSAPGTSRLPSFRHPLNLLPSRFPAEGREARRIVWRSEHSNSKANGRREEGEEFGWISGGFDGSGLRQRLDWNVKVTRAGKNCTGCL